MSCAGIIAEYDPFHNGHFLHLRATAQRAPDGVVVVLGGNFTQRGGAALLGKRYRTEAALRGGADLVLELPLPYALSGAQTFARGGVEILHALGCVDMLSFGSECGNTELLRQAARAVDGENTQFYMRRELGTGKPYAAAREAAVRSLYGDAVADVLHAPNNILGVEYIRACHTLAPEMQFMTVARRGAAHDAQSPTGAFASASFLREQIQKGETVSPFLPPFSEAILQRALQNGDAPASIEKLEVAVLAFLRKCTPQDFQNTPDISEGLENRILNAARTARTLSELFQAAKTKRYSHARIRRAVLSAFLGIENRHVQDGVPYLRVLGLSERGKQILHSARKTARVPIVLRASDIGKLSESAQQLFALECAATDVYALCKPRVGACGSEMTDNVVRF